eukprot:9295793-Ditylum_brightwellii.AAC.1
MWCWPKWMCGNCIAMHPVDPGQTEDDLRGAAGWQSGGRRFNSFLPQMHWGKSMMLGSGVMMTGALAVVDGGPVGGNEVRDARAKLFGGLTMGVRN